MGGGNVVSKMICRERVDGCGFITGFITKGFVISGSENCSLAGREHSGKRQGI